jgi:molybdopterin molybdotransferase/putative molybdopterin biosynthesis protein
MAYRNSDIICRLKKMRQAKGWTQTHLAELVGIKRQAVYDIESEKYVPNAAVALRLGKHLGCRVEDLFVEQDAVGDHPVTVVDRPASGQARLALARVRNRLVGYPLDGIDALNDGFRAADGFFSPKDNRVTLTCSPESIDKTILLLGCDPAFPILSAHVARYEKEAKVLCRFASSKRAIEKLAGGYTHLAGTHLHNKGNIQSNAVLAKQLLKGAKGLVIGFSEIEEGLMVAPGNPFGIKVVSDLTKPDVRLINRELGAGLRVLLDDYLVAAGVPIHAVRGYEDLVYSHAGGAQKVLHHVADAALGLRAVAEAFGLEFVPIASVRCDLIIPKEFADHTTVKILTNLLQSHNLRRELSSLPGYDCAETGKVVAEV